MFQICLVGSSRRISRLSRFFWKKDNRLWKSASGATLQKINQQPVLTNLTHPKSGV